MKKQTPTQQQFEALQKAYDYFNTALFFGKLPPCLLTISVSRKGKGLAFAIPNLWKKDGAQNTRTYHQISITQHIFRYELNTIFSALVHEMVHLWQFEFGTPGKRKYHNRQWAWKMKEVGLIPTSQNGMETGEQVWHYIEKGGRFEQALQKMPPACLLPFTAYKDSQQIGILKKETKINENKSKHTLTKRGRNKTTYICQQCKTKVWGKPKLIILCGTCNAPFEILPKKR